MTTTEHPAPSVTVTTVHPPVQPLAGWLTARRNAGATPDRIAGELVATGWSADQAASASIGSLRRSDRQPLLWFALCWSAGLGAVGLTTAAHQLLDPSGNRAYAALALTVSLVLLPVAAVCAVLAARVVGTNAHAIWSPDRRVWFGVLAAATATVGLFRLVTYVYAVVHDLLATPGGTLSGRDLAQVAVSLAVAIPLFTWSFLSWRRSDLAISGLSGPTDD